MIQNSKPITAITRMTDQLDFTRMSSRYIEVSEKLPLPTSKIGKENKQVLD
jgi:hypothetical protein